MTQNPFDEQYGGEHYKKLGEYQPWKMIEHLFTDEEMLGYIKGTVYGYIVRNKNGFEDFEKSMHHLQLFCDIWRRRHEGDAQARDKAVTEALKKVFEAMPTLHTPIPKARVPRHPETGVDKDAQYSTSLDAELYDPSTKGPSE